MQIGKKANMTLYRIICQCFPVKMKLNLNANVTLDPPIGITKEYFI